MRHLTGAGIHIGHLDTGVDAAHPELQGRIAAFRYFDHHGVAVPDAPLHDTGAHGTATASVICGGTVGVAPGATLYCGAVIDGGEVLVRVLAGLDWLLDCPIRILSMSLGIPGYHPLFIPAMQRFRAAGILPVLPVGNVGAGKSCSPGNYPGVLAVGAGDTSGQRLPFSGEELFERPDNAIKPDVLAIGMVRCARAGGGYVEQRGTSLASAYVAGLAALLWEAFPAAPLEAIEDALIFSNGQLAAALAYLA